MKKLNFLFKSVIFALFALPVAQVEAGKLIPVVIKDKDGKEKTILMPEDPEKRTGEQKKIYEDNQLVLENIISQICSGEEEEKEQDSEKLARELEREERERECKRKKQEQEDAEFALKLQQGFDSGQSNSNL